MERNELMTIVNGIASIVFVILTFIGLIGLFESLGDYSPLENKTLAFVSLFIIGGFGLISQLFIINLKSIK